MKTPRISNYKIILFCILVIVVFAPLIYQMIWVRSSGTDYPTHIILSTNFTHMRIPTPHFLFQLLVILASRLRYVVPGVDYFVSGFLISLFLYLFLFLALCYCFSVLVFKAPQDRPLDICFVAFSLMIIAPINVFTLYQQNLYHGYIVPNAYHNPTMVLLKPIALLHFFLSLRLISQKKDHLLDILILALLTVFSALAKPNYLIVWLPVVVFFEGKR